MRTLIRNGSVVTPQGVSVMDVLIDGETISALLTSGAGSDELVHGLEGIVIDAPDDLVEAVVDEAVAVGLGMPGGQAVLHALAVALDGEVDDRRRPTPGCGARARLEGVRGEGPAERQFHMRVRVDAAGDDVLAGRAGGCQLDPTPSVCPELLGYF